MKKVAFSFGLVALLALLPNGGLSNVLAETRSELKDRLAKELEIINGQILEQQVLVEDTQSERRSLERDIRLLDAEIKKAQLGIKAREVAIEQLGYQINDKELAIEELNQKLERHRMLLSDLLRRAAEGDDHSLAEVLLSEKSLSGFFVNFVNYQSVKSSLNQSVIDLKTIQNDTREQKTSLEDKQVTEARLKKLQEVAKQEIEAKEREKARILKITKGQEAAYQALLETQKKTAAEIRARLFPLLFTEGGGIPFAEAVKLAEFAGEGAGVDPALILAILGQESSFGAHLGSCTYNQLIYGDPAMNPERDWAPFLALAEVLGFDPAKQEVSCPLDSKGWGGAMGPSQFIPSTWAIYGGIVKRGRVWQYDKSKDRIRKIIGKNSPSNPFAKQDAFTATALLLRANGADGTYSGDRMAALIYYAGRSGAKKLENQFYGDQVMERKKRMTADIKTLADG